MELREQSRHYLGGKEHWDSEKFIDYKKVLDFEAFWQTWMYALLLKRDIDRNTCERRLFAMDSERIIVSWAVDGDERWLGYKNHLMTTIKGFLKNRRVAMSTTGHFCLVPSNAKCGDAICIMPGGRLPCVIRRVDSNTTQLDSDDSQITTLRDSEHYHFIGGCHVLGIMHGEAFQTYVRRGIKPIDFKLV